MRNPLTLYVIIGKSFFYLINLIMVNLISNKDMDVNVIFKDK